MTDDLKGVHPRRRRRKRNRGKKQSNLTGPPMAGPTHGAVPAVMPPMPVAASTIKSRFQALKPKQMPEAMP